MDGASLAKVIAKKDKEYTFAQTFPTGTHAMWLYYWLAAHGIDPFRDVKKHVVPPPQMVAQHARRHGQYCVGEPWNQWAAIVDKIGFRRGDHPGHLDRDQPGEGARCDRRFAAKNPNTPKDDLPRSSSLLLDRRQRR